MEFSNKKDRHTPRTVSLTAFGNRKRRCRACLGYSMGGQPSRAAAHPLLWTWRAGIYSPEKGKTVGGAGEQLLRIRGSVFKTLQF